MATLFLEKICFGSCYTHLLAISVPPVVLLSLGLALHHSVHSLQVGGVGYHGNLRGHSSIDHTGIINILTGTPLGFHQSNRKSYAVSLSKKSQ